MAKRKLVSKGKGNWPQATWALTETEEDKLFEEGYFGDHEWSTPAGHVVVPVPSLWVLCKG